jgi:Regulator of chromosome condensation (RCC1) repeat
MKHLWGVLLIALSTPASPIASSPSDAPHFISVTAGADHACALTDGGDAYCWGSNEFGQLRNGSSETAPQMVPVRVRTDVKFTIVAAGFKHTCGLERPPRRARQRVDVSSVDTDSDSRIPNGP